ncbi:MAG: SPFH domain-containing protein [Clostridiales bacterium]|nr:SPFH domain-containing protein [Clostridiales bacterium]
MGLLKNIEWTDDTSDTIVYRFAMKNDYVSKGSALTVRPSQVCIFCHKGQMADVFLPGFYKLDTDSIPFLTKLMSWKYGFENPFRSDVFFVNTKQFTNYKWGTATPIIVRDADYGAIRIGGYGTYSFKVDDAYVFMKELSGTTDSFTTREISDYLKSMVIAGITDAIGESKIPILDMAGNLLELGKMVEKTLDEDFKAIGIKITKFNFQSFSLPKELQEALDKSTSYGMMRGNMDVHMQMAQAEALKSAAKNPGMAGTTMGAGLGLGLGAGMGQMFSNIAQPQAGGANAGGGAAANTAKCGKCGASMRADAKFCPECGAASGKQCPHCGTVVSRADAKFCPECGKSLAKTCPKCKAAISRADAKFCPECGEKL